MVKSITSSAFAIPQGLETQQVFDFVRPKVIASWNEVRANIFNVGRWLVATKEMTNHGDWKDFVDTLPFSFSTAEKLRNIASCEVFQVPEVYEVLPHSWGTLDKLRRYAERQRNSFLELVKEGTIHSTIPRSKIRELFVKPNLTPSNASAPKSVFARSETGKVLVELTKKGEKFGTLYVDPPWKAAAGSKKPGIGLPAEYPTMTHQELLDMGKTVNALAADNSYLFLWALGSNVPQALEVMKAYGFTYKTNLIWVKPFPTNYTRYFGVQHEMLLVGIKGKPEGFGDHPPSVFEAERGNHSRKPDGIRDLIEEISPNNRIELFAREIFSGWVSWGNEISDNIYDGRITSVENANSKKGA